MGSGVLGAQVLGANSGVLVFKPWGCVQNMLVRFGSNFHWETKNGSTKFKDLAEGKRTLSSPCVHGNLPKSQARAQKGQGTQQG